MTKDWFASTLAGFAMTGGAPEVSQGQVISERWFSRPEKYTVKADLGK
jgi:hypothetical protein